MDSDRPMYQWRRMNAEQRQAVLALRRSSHRPWHGPPHRVGEIGHYLIPAACYEHKPIIGVGPERMGLFESDLLGEVGQNSSAIFGWVVLPNHYHVLVDAPDVNRLLHSLGQFHGRTSFRWNGEDRQRGRQIWFRAVETAIKSEPHFWATLNYVLNNAVRHGYVDRWQDWAYSNASQYLGEVGRDEALRRWREFPVLDYGKDWDPPEL